MSLTQKSLWFERICMAPQMFKFCRIPP